MRFPERRPNHIAELAIEIVFRLLSPAGLAQQDTDEQDQASIHSVEYRPHPNKEKETSPAVSFFVRNPAKHGLMRVEDRKDFRQDQIHGGIREAVSGLAFRKWAGTDATGPQLHEHQ